MYSFSLTLLFKALVVLNYYLREKNNNVSRLRTMAKISVFDLLIPGFLKSTYYFSMMIATIYFQTLPFLITLFVTILGI